MYAAYNDHAYDINHNVMESTRTSLLVHGKTTCTQPSEFTKSSDESTQNNREPFVETTTVVTKDEILCT